jgi:hypothetical protein
MSAPAAGIFNAMPQLHPALLMYLAVGVLTLAVAGGAHLWHHHHDEREPEWVESLAQEMNPEREKLWYRVRARVLAPVLTVIAMVLFWPAAWWMKCAELVNERRLAREREEAIFKVKPQHLLERLTVEEIEAREMVQDPLNAVPKVPFGHLNSVWLELKSEMQPGDELWSFNATWPGPVGSPELRLGYVLWQGRKPVRHVLAVCKQLEPVWPELPVSQATDKGARRADLSLDEVEIPAFLRKQAD